MKKRNLLIAVIVAVILLIVGIVFVVSTKDSANVSTNDVVVENSSNIDTEDDVDVGEDTNVELGDDTNESTEPSESEEDSNDISNEEDVLEDSTSEGEVSTLEPEVEVHEHAYVEERISEPTCTSVGLKKFTCECGEFYEEGIDMVAHELGDFVYNNDATYEKDGTESASCKVCGNVIETRTKEGTMLVKAPEPEVVVPPSSGGLDTTIGSELALNGTITSYNGATLNKLASFNKAGLYNPPSEYVSNYEWFGYFSNDDPNFANTTQSIVGRSIVSNLDSIMGVVGCQQGFSPWNDTIYFYFGTGGAAGEVELRRYPSKGYYTISINYEMNQGIGTSVTVNDGRDVLLAFCSMISSTPSELEDAIYRDCFGGGDTFISESGWTTIGDAKVQWAGYNNPGMYNYNIKPN